MRTIASTVMMIAIVTKGDVIIVPAGSPHWYSQVDGAITYLEVRWLAPK